MTTSPPSPESLAQARAELPMASIAAQSGDKTSARLLAERATVIALRRELDERDREINRMLEQWRKELATERQRHEDLLTQIRVQQTMLDSYQVDLATERQRAEAAEALANRRLHEREMAREQVDSVRRSLGCKVGEALDTQDIVALLRVTCLTGGMVDQVQHIREGYEAERLRLCDALAASEAKRKALREACEAIRRALCDHGKWPACDALRIACEALDGDQPSSSG